MEIAISKFDGEVEAEINIDLCCVDCAAKIHKWSANQFEHIRKLVSNKEPIPVPDTVDDSKKLAEYIASLAV